MIVKAIALYDFVGNPEAEEISFFAGDIITVTNMHSDDGWWEGKIGKDKDGFFPELYVELLPLEAENGTTTSALKTVPKDRIPNPPAALNVIHLPRPPAPESPSTTSSQAGSDSPAIRTKQEPVKRVGFSLDVMTQLSSKFASADISANSSASSTAIPSPISVINDSDTVSHEIEVENMPPQLNIVLPPVRQSSAQIHVAPDYSAPLPPSLAPNPIPAAAKASQIHDVSTQNPLRKSLNRFSYFVSSGTESFLLRNNPSKDLHVIDSQTVISLDGDGPRWIPRHHALRYKLLITGFANRAKYAGTKHYISYAIREENSGIIVYRRYKHFEWFHNILIAKFSTLCLPELPDKQVQGRFSEEFVEQRRRALENYLHRLERHPVVRESSLFEFFITCTDEKAWKAGKRAAENDNVVGGRFLQTVNVQNNPVPEEGDPNQMMSFSKFTKVMKLNGHALVDAASGFLYAAPTFSNIYARLSFSLKRLITRRNQKQKPGEKPVEYIWCWKENCEECAKLTQSVGDLSIVIKDIAVNWETHAVKACIPMIERIREYDRLVDAAQNVVELHDETLSRVKDIKRKYNGKPMNPEMVDDVSSRCSTVFNVALAEMNRFHDERCVDYRGMMLSFVQSQIDFHREMLLKLEAAKSSM